MKIFFWNLLNHTFKDSVNKSSLSLFLFVEINCFPRIPWAQLSLVSADLNMRNKNVSLILACPQSAEKIEPKHRKDVNINYVIAQCTYIQCQSLHCENVTLEMLYFSIDVVKLALTSNSSRSTFIIILSSIMFIKNCGYTICLVWSF